MIQTLDEKTLHTLLQTAIQAVRAAGHVLKQGFLGPLQVRKKENDSFVTQMDLAAEQAAIHVLKSSFPEFSFLTEEAPAEPGSSPGRWILDPLDGTTNYIHGFPFFCVSLAAEWQNQLQVGVIYHPLFEELYTACQGQGAFLNGQPLFVSSTQDLHEALLTTGFHPGESHELAHQIRIFEHLSQCVHSIRRPGSAALDLAYTARGIFDGFWEQSLKAWDIAAGALLVQEAGGQVSNYQGHALCLEKGEILASNSLLHQSVVHHIQSIQ